MTTIIRRYRRPRRASLLTALAATILLMAMTGWVLAIIWEKGGPQPVHDIVIALPAPKPAPAGPHP